jgi:NhaP-type Na+/H+ or K+/H+ antiporter
VPDMLTAFALIAIALTVSALVSKVVERGPLSFPILFLGLGFFLSGRGLGYISIEPDDGSLEVVAVLSLAFVLFLDAVRMRLDEIRREWFVPVLVLGLGTMMAIGGVALRADHREGCCRARRPAHVDSAQARKSPESGQLSLEDTAL